jgi:hypothetical protein
VKCRPPHTNEYSLLIKRLIHAIRRLERAPNIYRRLATGDISESYFRILMRELRLPPIPRIHHWFKRYVQIDLARLWPVIMRQPARGRLRWILLTSFASILRLCSNADPDTLSGLEVTKRMRTWLRRGRYLNPYQVFIARLERNLEMLEDFWRRRRITADGVKARGTGLRRIGPLTHKLPGEQGCGRPHPHIPAVLQRCRIRSKAYI